MIWIARIMLHARQSLRGSAILPFDAAQGKLAQDDKERTPRNDALCTSYFLQVTFD